MTFAPQTIKDLAALWVANGGENLGIVGDSSHAATGGYHEGKDDLLAAGVLATDYSVQQARDKAGLSNAAAAFDLGQLHGSLANLQAFSRWLVAQCQAGAAGTDQIREVIYSPDGVYVMRWSGVDHVLHTSLRKNADGSITVIEPKNGDAGHFEHTHISFFRDTEFLAKTQLFAPYFAAAPQEPVNMGVPINVKAASGIFTTGPNGATSWRVRNGADGPVGPGEPQTVVGQGDLDGANIAGGVVSGVWFTSAKNGELYAYPKSQGTFVADNVPATPPASATEAQKQYDADALALAEHLLGKRP